jgi:hypothetical protein
MGYSERRHRREKVRILVGIPCNFSMYYGQFVKSLEQLQIDPSKVELIHAHIGTALIHDMRNKAVIQALKHECTHLLMVDADGVLPYDLIIRLLSWNVDIVGATVWRRHPPFHPAAYVYNPKSLLYDPVPPDEWVGAPDLLEVDAVGAAAILISTRVFKDMRNPFSPITFKHGDDEDMYGEDISFCHRARAQGFKVHVDTGLTVGHLLQGAYIGPNGVLFTEENIAYIPAEVLGEKGPPWLQRYYGAHINNGQRGSGEGVCRVPGQPASITDAEREACRVKEPAGGAGDRPPETGVDQGLSAGSDPEEPPGPVPVRSGDETGD